MTVKWLWNLADLCVSDWPFSNIYLISDEETDVRHLLDLDADGVRVTQRCCCVAACTARWTACTLPLRGGAAVACSCTFVAASWFGGGTNGAWASFGYICCHRDCTAILFTFGGACASRLRRTLRCWRTPLSVCTRMPRPYVRGASCCTAYAAVPACYACRVCIAAVNLAGIRTTNADLVPVWRSAYDWCKALNALRRRATAHAGQRCGRCGLPLPFMFTPAFSPAESVSKTCTVSWTDVNTTGWTCWHLAALLLPVEPVGVHYSFTPLKRRTWHHDAAFLPFTSRTAQAEPRCRLLRRRTCRRYRVLRAKRWRWIGWRGAAV